MQWKRALLADLGRAERSAPVPLPAAPAPFQKVEVTGRLRDDLAARYRAELGATESGPTMGARLIEPLERPGAAPVLVDRGWMPDKRPIPPSPDPATVVGYVRPPDRPGLFSPPDDPAGRRFYTLDPKAVGRALGLDRVAPFTVVALGPPGGFPEPARALPRPANDHLGYAVTWFGLGLCVLGVFGAYVWKGLRE